MELNVTGPRILFTIPIFGGLQVNETLRNSWVVILIIFILCLILTHKLEKIPRKRTQQLAEKLVTMFDNMVIETMGVRNKAFAPYIMTLFFAAVLGSLISLFGFRSVTADINTTATWAIMTFILIYVAGIKQNGFKHFKGLLEPFAFMLPLNIFSELAKPLSMALRMFCNVSAGMIITSLIYAALGVASNALLGFINVTFPVLAIGLPGVLSVYFDVFTGIIQPYVFCMLTMVFVSNANEVEEA